MSEVERVDGRAHDELRPVSFERDFTTFAAGSDRARDAGSGPGSARFLSSGDPCWFATLGRRLLGMELGEVAPVRWPR